MLHRQGLRMIQCVVVIGDRPKRASCSTEPSRWRDVHPDVSLSESGDRSMSATLKVSTKETQGLWGKL
jgi:hypothetical protein